MYQASSPTKMLWDYILIARKKKTAGNSSIWRNNQQVTEEIKREIKKKIRNK